VLLQSLAVPDPSELVNLSAPGPKPGFQSCGQAGDCDVVFSYAMFRDLQKVQTVFTDIAAHVGFGANLAYEAQTSSAESLLVSGSYFPALELQPALGRLLNSNDDQLVGESRVVVLGYNYWSPRFGLDRTILNKRVIVNSQRLTIVGVAPKGFDGTTIGMRPAVFVPITLRSVLADSTGWSLRTDYWAYLFARLRPRGTIEAARASLGTQYHAIINDVEAPMQKDMSPQTMARFRAKSILLAPVDAARARFLTRRRRRSASCLASRLSCCSSPAPISPTCCSRDRPRAPERWPSGSRSARAGRA
jgi:hypothetical protein